MSEPESATRIGSADPPRRRASGTWVVWGMIGFGVLATGLLYLYWDLHTRPFRPLQEAIARAYPGSQPIVQGGREEMEEATPRVLRIVLRVDFDPHAERNEARVQRRFDRVTALARRHHDLAAYEKLEIYLNWMRPEQRIEERGVVRDVSEVIGG